MIYLLEDDDSIRKLVLYGLDSQGFQAKGFALPSEFWRAMDAEMPELILLDIMLPEEDGLSILRKLRARPATKRLPIIMLTAKNSEYDRVIGLDHGADDFVSKPFSMLELIARIRAVLRRAEPAQASGDFSLGLLFVSPDRHEVKVGGKDVYKRQGQSRWTTGLQMDSMHWAVSMLKFPRLARSARESMPVRCPFCVTGRRRSCARDISRAARAVSSEASTARTPVDIISRTGTASASFPAATQRRTTSRSVTIPHRRPSGVCTGRMPRLYRLISRAATLTGSCVPTLITCFVIQSLTFIGFLPFTKAPAANAAGASRLWRL